MHARAFCFFPSRFSEWSLRFCRANFFLAAGILFSAHAFSADRLPQSQPRLRYRSDRILVQPKARVNQAALDNLHLANQGKAIKTFAGLGQLQVVSLPAGASVKNVVSNYQASGLVEFAEPDYFVQLAATFPNDPKFLDGSQWGLYNYGQIGSAGADIDAPEGWDILSSASNIVVAVIDTGIRYTHEDLAANIWTNAVDGGQGFNSLTGSHDPWDDHGHGTLISGVIGAVGNNGLGIAGVAWRVQLMACKCVDAAGEGSYSDLIAGVDFARTHGARIVNISLGDYENSQSFSNALLSLRADGIIIVAACGNDSTNTDVNPFYPASYNFDNVVAVTSVNYGDTLSYYSNFGATTVALAAPGDLIASTYNDSDNSYWSGTGTSIASPCVAGALALMLARFPNEDYRQIIARLLKTTDPLPSLAGKCVSGGRLNLFRALSSPNAPSLQIISAVAGSPLQLRLTGTASQTYVLETSTNLLNWSPINTNTTSASGILDFADRDPANHSSKFYRAVSSL